MTHLAAHTAMQKQLFVYGDVLARKGTKPDSHFPKGFTLTGIRYLHYLIRDRNVSNRRCKLGKVTLIRGSNMGGTERTENMFSLRLRKRDKEIVSSVCVGRSGQCRRLAGRYTGEEREGVRNSAKKAWKGVGERRWCEEIGRTEARLKTLCCVGRRRGQCTGLPFLSHCLDRHTHYPGTPWATKSIPGTIPLFLPPRLYAGQVESPPWPHRPLTPLSQPRQMARN